LAGFCSNRRPESHHPRVDEKNHRRCGGGYFKTGDLITFASKYLADGKEKSECGDDGLFEKPG